MKLAGALTVALVVLLAIAAPACAPHDAHEQFRGFLLAPPMRLHVRHEGAWRRPFVYPLRLVDALERRYEDDRTRPVPLAWATGGRLLRSANEDAAPLFLLGTDSLGRDVFARLAYGARVSLAVAALAALGTIAIGLLVGAAAGYAGGLVDDALMRVSDFVLVLPTVYVALALRAALPLVMPAFLVFTVITGVLALVGWPYIARGVRAIIAGERDREYAMAARSAGAGHARVLLRHLLPAASGFLAVQTTLLVPAFVFAEATLSFVGLGFAEPLPSWGTMLRDAADVRVLTESPWLLAPAVAIVVFVIGLHLLVARHTPASGTLLVFPKTRRV